MKPNPGGILTGNTIIDREKEINSIWRGLQNQSVVLISERRVGKTCILRKMKDNPRDKWNPLLYWVEGKQHPIEFIEGLYEELQKSDLLKVKFPKLKKFYAKYAKGKDIGNMKFPELMENWKPLLESVIEDIVTSEKKVLLMFDELPLMVAKFIKSEEIGPIGGMEFLDTLRELRNKYEGTKNISFIFCGSIGMDLIIKDLKKNHGYNSDPLNNMKIISISGMDKNGAKELCEKLSEDEDYKFKKKDEIFDYICEQTDCLPFYIQHVFAYIIEEGIKDITEDTINKSINSLLNDPKDIGFFRHYLDRIKTYYDKQNQEIALLILDKMCKLENYWKENDIFNAVKTNREIDDETIYETLALLWSDHYLIREIRNSKRFYKFKYTILQNWWIKNRG
jgi:hypothetical protein